MKLLSAFGRALFIISAITALLFIVAFIVSLLIPLGALGFLIGAFVICTVLLTGTIYEGRL